MALPAAHLLLLCTGLLAAPESRAPEPRARPPPPGNELPAGLGQSRAAPEPGAQRGRVDPHAAWMLFVRQSDRGANGKAGSRGRARRPKVPALRAEPPRSQGSPCGGQRPEPAEGGPAASPPARTPPPAAPLQLGPPGPPEVPPKEPRLLLRGAVQQRARADLEPEACTSGPGPGPAAPREDDDEAPGELAAPLAPDLRAPRVQAAFRCRLRRDTWVERRALRELGAYYLPDAEGAFGRGPGLNLTSGQYAAPVAGFYVLAATLHVALREPPRRGPARPRDRLRLLICIQSRCQAHASLEAVAGLEGGVELLTVSVSGVLYLQTGQYASVFLDNASGSALTVRSGSHFSAVLLGV